MSEEEWSNSLWFQIPAITLIASLAVLAILVGVYLWLQIRK